MKTTSTTTTTKVNPFDTDSFRKQVADLQTRSNNAATTTQRMGLGDTSNTLGVSNLNKSYQSAGNTSAQINANDPINQRLIYQDNRNFTEDSRRFDAALGAKSSALANEQSTIRYQSDNSLSGVKYNADAGVKSTQIGADAQVASTRLQADASRYGADKSAQASMYGADKGYQASIYGADRGVDQARIGADAQIRASEIGADASRFNALLGTASNIFNSSGYRPTFNR